MRDSVSDPTDLVESLNLRSGKIHSQRFREQYRDLIRLHLLNPRYEGPQTVGAEKFARKAKALSGKFPGKNTIPISPLWLFVSLKFPLQSRYVRCVRSEELLGSTFAPFYKLLGTAMEVDQFFNHVRDKRFKETEMCKEQIRSEPVFICGLSSQQLSR